MCVHVLKLKTTTKKTFSFEIYLVNFPKFCIDLHRFILWFQDSSLKKYCPVQLCSLVTLHCGVCKLVGCFLKAESVLSTDCTDTTKEVLCWEKVGEGINSNVKISYSCGASPTSRQIYCLRTKTVFSRCLASAVIAHTAALYHFSNCVKIAEIHSKYRSI